MKKHLTSLLAILFISLIFSACRQAGCTDPGAINYDALANEYDGSCKYSIFDKSTMLSHIGNNIIIARYSNLKANLDILLVEANEFVATPSTAKLTDLKTAHYNAYLQWQKCSAFEFGPGEDNVIRSHENTFPTDTANINANIASGSYTLTSFTAIQVKGFPALDFLVYGVASTDDDIVTEYTSSLNFENRKTYLIAVITELQDRVETVYDSWTSTTSGYITTFVDASGTDISSSLGYLTNQLVYDIELIKNASIGVPLGKFTLGTVKPEQTEAYYAGHSMALARAGFTALYDLYMGQDEFGGDGPGIYDYLVSLNTQGTDGLLADEIQNQFKTVTNALAVVSDPLSETVTTNTASVDTAYEAIKKLVALVKTDMPAAMGISITYVDNDGD